MPEAMLDLMRLTPVIAVLTIADPKQAPALARALVAGGLKVLEVTLRTPASLDAIQRIAGEVPDAVVGAGTVLSSEQAQQATRCGAKFLVSPGTSLRLWSAMAATGLPCLPGAATVSECLTLAEQGVGAIKLFPAEQLGGPGFIMALAGPLPHLTFCPTGGVSPANAPAYLALANIACVGASFPAPEALIAAGAFDKIEALARMAAALRTTPGPTPSTVGRRA